jgi:hypothetical protein
VANTWANEGLRQFGLGNIAWKASGGSTIKAILIDTAFYTFSSAHANLSDIPVGARVGTPVTLTLIDAADGGVLDANDISFTGLSSPPTCEALWTYKDTGVEATSTLLHYIDTATSGLPTPAGASQVDVAWNDGANKIARL